MHGLVRQFDHRLEAGFPQPGFVDAGGVSQHDPDARGGAIIDAGDIPRSTKRRDPGRRFVSGLRVAQFRDHAGRGGRVDG